MRNIILLLFVVFLMGSCRYSVEQEYGRFNDGELKTYVWWHNGDLHPKIIHSWSDFVTEETIDSISCLRYKQAENYIVKRKLMNEKIRNSCK